MAISIAFFSMRPPSFYQGFHITYSLLKPSTSIAFLSMRRVVDWGVADLTWCSFCAECLLCARFTSERGSWVDWHRGRWGAAEGAGVRAAVINPQSKRSWLVPRHRPCTGDRTAVGWWVWMVVRLVCVIRVPVCLVCVPAPPGVFLQVFLPVPRRNPSAVVRRSTPASPSALSRPHSSLTASPILPRAHASRVS